MKKTNEEKQAKSPFFGIPKLKKYLSKYKFMIARMVIFSMISSSLEVFTPLFQEYAIKNFVGAESLKGLGAFLIIFFAFLTIQVVGQFVHLYVTHKVEFNLGTDLRRASFNRLQELSISYYNQTNVGTLHSRVMSDSSRISENFAWRISDMTWDSLYLIGVTIVMFIKSWKLALCVLAMTPIMVLVSVLVQRRRVRLHREMRRLNAEISGGFNEEITGVKTTKSLVAERVLEGAFFKKTRSMRRVQTADDYTGAFLWSFIEFSSSVALALVLWYGGKITIDGVMLIGTLSVFMSYALNSLNHIQSVAQSLTGLIITQVNVERLTTLIETVPDVNDTPEVIEKYGDCFNPKYENWEEMYGDVEFKDVTFKYPDGDEYVLEHFNLKVPKGTNVAIVGETGAGKSTIVNLVTRMFEPTEGQVLIDGKDIRERSQLWLRSNMGYVLQTPHLFSGSIADNIRYGRLDATQEEIEEAVKSVSADKIVEKMDGGYNADVGEGGDLLSTGEKQLLSFARAIIAKPKIFILDEATSSIDTVTEKLIQDAIEKIMKDRTSFVIAHRLSTIRQADIILVIDKGKIVERGTHEELLKAKGVYYNLYLKQFQNEKVSESL